MKKNESENERMRRWENDNEEMKKKWKKNKKGW